MKHTLLLLLLNIGTLFASSIENTASNIKNVTVFLDGAQITRTATVEVNQGTTLLHLKQLSPYIQPNSIQVSGLNGASVLSVKYTLDYINTLEVDTSIENLRASINNLTNAIALEDNLIHGYKGELKIIKDNGVLGNANQTVTLDKLKQFAVFYRTRITALHTLINNAETKQSKLKIKRDAVEKQLNVLQSKDKVETGIIALKLNSSINTILQLTVKYNVSHAGWFPVYDLKAKAIDSPLHLDYKAHVYQNTGVNWKNVKLKLSTADPNVNNTKPKIAPKYLNLNSRRIASNAISSYNYKFNPSVRVVNGSVTGEDGIPLPGVNVLENGTNRGTVTDFDGKYTLEVSSGNSLTFSYIGFKGKSVPIHSSIMHTILKEDVESLEEVVVMGYAAVEKPKFGKHPNFKPRTNTVKSSKIKKEQLTSNSDIIHKTITYTNFEIAKTATLNSSNEFSSIAIDAFEIPAEFTYFAAPVLNENVFLTAKFGNWQRYNLLPGDVNVYFNDSFSGVTAINPYSTADSLSISLGIDPYIVVNRKAKTNFKTSNFTGSHKVLEKGFTIALKNNKTTPIKIVIVDRIPVSQDKSIKVDDVTHNTNDYNPKSGVLKWTATVQPSKTTKCNFSYSVKYPKHATLNL